jgi:uncharacterized membrane protein YkoI
MDGEYFTLESTMKAPRIILRAVTIALAMGIGLALTGATSAAEITEGSLSKAVSALESSTGGRVLEIRLVDEKGHERFESAIAKANAIIYMAINPVNEEVTKIDIKEVPGWMFDWKLTAYVKSIEKATVPLTKAIADAEAIAKAPAIGAGLAKPLSGTNQVLAYNVELLAHGKRTRIAIDATNGAKIANPEELYEPWTPVKLLRG